MKRKDKETYLLLLIGCRDRGIDMIHLRAEWFLIRKMLEATEKEGGKIWRLKR